MENSTGTGFNLSTDPENRTIGGYYDPSTNLSVAIVFSVIFGILAIIGLVGNGVTIFVICKMPELRKSPFNVFILSLCVSDFLSSVNSPFYVYRTIWGFAEYGLPDFFCRASVALDKWTSDVTIQHIFTFALLRILCLQFPFAMRLFRKRIAQVIVCAIWLETGGFTFVFYYLVRSVNFDRVFQTMRCTPTPSWKPIMRTYVRYSFPVFRYFPMIAIFVFTLVIAFHLISHKRKTDENARTSKRKKHKTTSALVQISLILGAFYLGYIPETAYVIMTARRVRMTDVARANWYLVFCLCLRVSECLNPFLYNFGSSMLKEATLECLKLKSVVRKVSSGMVERQQYQLNKMKQQATLTESSCVKAEK